MRSLGIYSSKMTSKKNKKKKHLLMEGKKEYQISSYYREDAPNPIFMHINKDHNFQS